MCCSKQLQQRQACGVQDVSDGLVHVQTIFNASLFGNHTARSASKAVNGLMDYDDPEEIEQRRLGSDNEARQLATAQPDFQGIVGQMPVSNGAERRMAGTPQKVLKAEQTSTPPTKISAALFHTPSPPRKEVATSLPRSFSPTRKIGMVEVPITVMSPQRQPLVVPQSQQQQVHQTYGALGIEVLPNSMAGLSVTPLQVAEGPAAKHCGLNHRTQREENAERALQPQLQSSQTFPSNWDKISVGEPNVAAFYDRMVQATNGVEMLSVASKSQRECMDVDDLYLQVQEKLKRREASPLFRRLKTKA